MSEEFPRRALAPGLHRLAIDGAGLAVILLGLVEIAVIAESELGPQVGTLILPVIGIEHALLGWYAWRRRPGNPTGLILLAGALAWIGAGLANTLNQPLTAVGLIVTSLPLATSMHLLHAFPSGRLRGPSGPIMAATYFVALVLEVPSYLFNGAFPPPIDVLTLADRPELMTWGEYVQNTAGVAVLVATATVLVYRLGHLDPLRRRVMGPLLAYGFASIALQPVASHVLPTLGLSIYASQMTSIALLAGVPLAFVLCLLLGGFGRTSEVHELGMWLATGPSSRSSLAQALRSTLGDPTLLLWFWVRGGYADADGHPVEPVTNPDRGLVEIDLGGERIGAISYDATLLTDRRAVETAGRVIALAVDRERLTTQLLAARTSLRNTLARVVETGDAERRRIARDLHDGLQSRLVLLGMSAYQIEREPGDLDSVVATAAELRRGLEHSVEELRRLVAGVMPATLLERGLYAATEDFVSSLPIRTRLEISGAQDALPSAVESTAYFVLTEAITNALKHARANQLTVALDRAGDRLKITVEDDGVGGAHGASGSGLAGLADRVGALGGRFDVESTPGHGTRLRAEVPCGS